MSINDSTTRRVLGSNEQEIITDIDVKSPSADAGESDQQLFCPICNEEMITLNQLNRHIDDAHGDGYVSESPSEIEAKLSKEPEASNTPSYHAEFLNGTVTKWIKNNLENGINVGGNRSPNNSQINSPFTSPIKPKNIKLDILDDNKSFSIRDNHVMYSNSSINNNNPNTENSPKKLVKNLSRTHWQKPSNSSDICSYSSCNKSLNVKNGKVNCRKCGKLFCNEHTHYRVRLKNGNPYPEYEPSKSGIWSRVCIECHSDKPQLSDKHCMEALSNDVTPLFIKLRSKYSDIRDLEQSKIQKRLIKLIHLLATYYLASETNNSFSFWNKLTGNSEWSSKKLLESQIDIVGRENWEQDEKVKCCPICYTLFNILTRRHHCRTCGRIICDGTLNDKDLVCSMDIPGGVILKRLPNLNYSPLVLDNFHRLCQADELFRFRICLDCKNLLSSEWKMNQKDSFSKSDLESKIFKTYEQLLAAKDRITHLSAKYSTLTRSHNSEDVNKIRSKLMAFIRDYESLTTLFKETFFTSPKNSPEQIGPNPSLNPTHQQIVKNIYQSSIQFLQETLINVKDTSNLLKEQDKEDVQQSKNQLEYSIKQNVETPEKPPANKLTKRQIRKFRDELMVMNEQKFIVENLISTATKQRKFDEIPSLNENKLELENRIASLENQLGDFAF